MTKSELIAKVSGKTELSAETVTAVLNAAISAIAKELFKGNSVQIIGFGTFATTVKAARKGRNPRTGEEIIIPPHKSPVFRASKALKEACNR